MKFALDTYRDVVSGDSQRRAHALITFGLWFTAGGFLTSVLSEYVSVLESFAGNLAGALVVSIFVAFVKVS